MLRWNSSRGYGVINTFAVWRQDVGILRTENLDVLLVLLILLWQNLPDLFGRPWRGMKLLEILVEVSRRDFTDVAELLGS